MNTDKDYIEDLVPKKIINYNTKNYILDKYISQFSDQRIYEIYKELKTNIKEEASVKTAPLISYIVIDTFNDNKSRKCIKALSRQLLKDIEVIVISCCHNDKKNKIEIINNIPVIYLNLSVCKPRSEMIKIGLEKSNGNYICIINGDQYFESKHSLDLEQFIKLNHSDIICYNKDYKCFFPIIINNLVSLYNIDIIDCCIRRDVLTKVLPKLNNFEVIISEIFIHKCISLKYKVDFLYSIDNQNLYNEIFTSNRWKNYMVRTFDDINPMKFNYLKSFLTNFKNEEIFFLNILLNNKVLGNFNETIIRNKLKRIIDDTDFENYLTQMLLLNYIEQLITMMKCLGRKFCISNKIDTVIFKCIDLRESLTLEEILKFYVMNFDNINLEMSQKWCEINNLRILLDYIWYYLYPRTSNRNKLLKVFSGKVKQTIVGLICNNEIIVSGRIQLLVLKRRLTVYDKR